MAEYERAEKFILRYLEDNLKPDLTYHGIHHTLEVIARAMETGYFRKDDVWEIVFETGALMQGLVMLYLGGRMAMTPAQFRAFCHRSFGRYLNGIRS